MVKAGKLVQFSEVRAGGSYISQNDPRLHFGLGAEAKMNEVEIRWPSGKVELLRDVPADFIYTIVEGRGSRASSLAGAVTFIPARAFLPASVYVSSFLVPAVGDHASGGRRADLGPRHGFHLIDRAELFRLALLLRHPTHLAIACGRQNCNN